MRPQFKEFLKKQNTQHRIRKCDWNRAHSNSLGQGGQHVPHNTRLKLPSPISSSIRPHMSSILQSQHESNNTSISSLVSSTPTCLRAIAVPAQTSSRSGYRTESHIAIQRPEQIVKFFEHQDMAQCVESGSCEETAHYAWGQVGDAHRDRILCQLSNPISGKEIGMARYSMCAGC